MVLVSVSSLSCNIANWLVSAVPAGPRCMLFHLISILRGTRAIAHPLGAFDYFHYKQQFP